MRREIETARLEGDSVGGVIECAVTGVPAGFGGPLFGGAEGVIAQAVFGIPAVKGVEFGAGFASATMRGSQNNDPFCIKDGSVVTETNHCGGILGGITDGMPVVFRAAIKPTPSIAQPQRTVDLAEMKNDTITVKGRHDPCIVPRAVPVVEAAAAVAIINIL
jgi:chorismate synthase